jgi:hypothetical protein
MMAVFRHSGFPVMTSIEDGEISVRFSISPADARTTPQSGDRAQLD